MLRRRTVLESPSIDLPQRDKDHLLVMSVGGNDLFGPNARKVQEWKWDTEEEKVKLISRVFEERENRDKAAKRKSSASSSRPPRFLAHQSPLDGISTPRSKDSYQRPPSQPFQSDSHKQPSFKSRQSSSSKGQSSSKDKKSSQSTFRSGSREQGPARRDKESKGSQQSRSFNKRGWGGGGNQRK